MGLFSGQRDDPADIFAAPGKHRGKRPVAVRGSSAEPLPQPPARVTRTHSTGLRTSPSQHVDDPPTDASTVVPAGPPAAPIDDREQNGAVDDAFLPESRDGSPNTSRVKKRMRGSAGPEKVKTKADKVAFTQALGGARGLQLTLRVILTVAAVTLVLVGLKQVVYPSNGVSEQDVQDVVDAKLAETSQYPSVSAEGFAIGFAQTYYTWSPQMAKARADALKTYLPPTVKDGWGGEGEQQVVSGPYIAKTTTVESKSRGTVHLAFETDTKKWLYVGVVVLADGPDQLVVGSAPVFEPPPTQAEYTGKQSGEVDDDASAALATDMPAFFTAWGQSASAELNRYLAPDPSAAATSGLGGTVVFVSIDDVSVTAGTSDTRTAVAAVKWSTGPLDDPGSAAVMATYQLTVVFLDGRWYVKDVVAGEADAAPAEATSSSSPSSAPGQPGQSSPTTPAPTPGG